MFYRVRPNLCFTEEDAARDFYDNCQDALEKSVIINPGQPNEEGGVIVLEYCYHDEDPTKECVVLKSNHI